MSREGRRHAEVGRPARRGNPSPAPFLQADPSTLVFGNVSSFAGGGGIEDLGRPGGNCQAVIGTPASHAPRPMTKGVRGLPRGGDPAAFHSLEEWARTGPSRSLQGAARRPRLTSPAMMSRRVVERRRVEKKWWAPSTNAAQSGLVPDAPHLRQVRLRARSESESRRDPETRRTRKGKQRAARHVPDGGVDRRGSPGGVSCPRRNANRATAPAREKVSSSVGVPARRSSSQVAESEARSSLPHECRKADRAASEWWTTLSASKDTTGELLRAKRGDESEEGVSDRPKPSPSRGAVEAVSILRAPRKLSCEGGSVTRRVTGCQRRSRERNERTSSTGEIPAAREGEQPSPLPHGPPKRVQRVVKRRTHRSHRTALNSRAGRSKVGNRERGCRFRKKSGWQKSVGRIVTLA